MANANIDSNYINQFSGVLHHLTERDGFTIRPTVMNETASGEKHFFDRLGSFTASVVTGRANDTELQDPNHSRRMATVERYRAGTYLDDIDKLKMLIDPSSDYARKLGFAHARNYDDVVIDAMLGTASTGKTGDGTQAFDTANNQIAHGSNGLTVVKFNEALRILEETNVNIMSGITMALPPRATEDLMGDTTGFVTSFDYQPSKPLADGQLPTFRGVSMLRTNALPHETTDTTYRALMYTKDSTKVAISQDIDVKISERADKDYLWQVVTYMMFGAVRMEEDLIVDILFQ